jgi:AraC family transcriptional regulator, transcriptional activator of pobA
METIVHHKISDLYKTLYLPVEQEIDFTVLSIPDIHPQIPFTSPKLRADYFSFILTKNGSGIYFLDDHKFPFDSRTFYFTNPGHIKSYELYESKEAYIIALSDAFLMKNVHSDIFTEFPFLLAEKSPPEKLSQSDFEDFSTLYNQIIKEFNKNSDYKNKILGNLFTVLLLKIKEKFWVNYNPIEEGNRNSQIVKSFKQLLESEFRRVMDNEQNESKLQAQYLAEQLNLHPNYLNSVIKSKTGKTVYDWISHQTLIVAKDLLLNTSYSSKEIAYKLGFSEPTHFSRFFKKHTLLSPGTFRKSNKL